MLVQTEKPIVKSDQKPPRLLFVKIAVLAVIVMGLYQATGDEVYLLVLGLLAIPPAMLWTVPPILFHNRNQISANPSSDLYDLDSPDVPDSVASTIPDQIAELSELGFTCVGHFHRHGFSTFPETEGYVALLIHRQSRCAARVGVMWVRNQRAAIMIRLAAYTTEFTDGTRLATVSRDSELPMTGLRQGSMAFTEIREVRRLFQIHQAAVNRFCGDSFRRDIWSLNPEQYQRDSIEHATARLAEIGYYRLDEDRQVYRPTWRGAIAITAKLRWPIKPILSLLQRRRADRMLRELGLDERETHDS